MSNASEKHTKDCYIEDAGICTCFTKPAATGSVSWKLLGAILSLFFPDDAEPGLGSLQAADAAIASALDAARREATVNVRWLWLVVGTLHAFALIGMMIGWGLWGPTRTEGNTMSLSALWCLFSFHMGTRKP